jgi:hypothetical protein
MPLGNTATADTQVAVPPHRRERREREERERREERGRREERERREERGLPR